MKYAALSLIFVCMCFLGQTVSKQLEKRVSMLEKIYVLFSDICSRIEFTADTSGDIFSSLARSDSYDILPFVKECEALMKEGKSFDEGWIAAIKNIRNTSSLKKEDINILISFSQLFGATDVSGQISNCRLHMELIKEKISLAKKDFEMYSRPAKGIGLLSGTAVFIFFM